MGPLSLAALRNNLFKIADEVIKTGSPLELKRKGHRLMIVLGTIKSKLENLKPHDRIIGNPDEPIDLTVAEAAVAKQGFISADRDIRLNYTQTIW